MGFIVIGVTWQISSSHAVSWPVPMLAARFQGRERERAEGSLEFAPRKLNTIRETEQMQSFQYSAGGGYSRSLFPNKEGL